MNPEIKTEWRKLDKNKKSCDCCGEKATHAVTINYSSNSNKTVGGYTCNKINCKRRVLSQGLELLSPMVRDSLKKT